jgi:hypothetical protein
MNMNGIAFYSTVEGLNAQPVKGWSVQRMDAQQ